MKKIILFDGECNLCNKAVDFVIDRDPQEMFQFASIQSKIGRDLIRRCGGDPDHVTAMYLIQGEKHYKASTAALHIAKELSRPWPLFYYLGIWVPRPLRDTVYYIVSKTRFRLFGKINTCRIMTPELTGRFLDSESLT